MKVINGIRYYEKNGKEYPSVTSILKYYPKGENFYNWLKSHPNADIILEEAGEYGKKTHQAIEKYLTGIENPELSLSENEMLSFCRFVDWFEELKKNHKVEVIGIEETLISNDFNYAGTADLILRIDGLIHIVDIKTSNGLWPNYDLQLSAYKHAFNEMNWVEDDVGYGKYIQEANKINILHVNYKLSTYELIEIEDRFDVFLAVKSIFDYEEKRSNKTLT